MSKWDRLLAQLDKLFGFEDRARSTVKKRRQLFDVKTGEHVFIIEYRVVKGEHSDPKKRKEVSIERRAKRYQVGKPLQEIHNQVQMSGLARVGTPDGGSPYCQPPGRAPGGQRAGRHLGLKTAECQNPVRPQVWNSGWIPLDTSPRML